VFSEASLLKVGLLVTVLMLAVTELGFQIGRHRSAECDSGVGAVKAAVLALVGLLLAFSYSIAAEHYDRRVQGMVAEAKAIKACWMRLALADEPARSRARELLTMIVDVRLESLASARNPPGRRRTEEQVIGHQYELWAIAAAQFDQSREPEKHLLLAQSVSDVIDRGGERAAAAENRVPSSVMYMLVTSILVSGFLIGLVRPAIRDA
jgi:hypothetical protein